MVSKPLYLSEIKGKLLTLAKRQLHINEFHDKILRHPNWCYRKFDYEFTFIDMSFSEASRTPFIPLNHSKAHSIMSKLQ
jgi:hypothetical protein